MTRLTHADLPQLAVELERRGGLSLLDSDTTEDS